MTRLARISSTPLAHAGPRRDDTLNDRLLDNVMRDPNGAAYRKKVGGVWATTTWAEMASQVHELSRACIAHGLEKGSTATIYSRNSAEWVLADLGLANIGAVSAGATPELNAPGVAHIVNDSRSRILFVEDLEYWNKVAPAVAKMPKVEAIVIMSGEKVAHPKAKTWSQFIATGLAVDSSEVVDRHKSVGPSDIATLVYTSGTTGAPKGVMLSHDNLSFAGEAFVDLTKATSRDLGMCYLQLGHVADRAFSVCGPITAGMEVAYTTAKTIKEDLLEVRPTILFGVPRVWDALAAGIAAALDGLSKIPVVRELLSAAHTQGRIAADKIHAGEEPGGIGYALANTLILKPIKRKIGIDRVRLAASGAAKLKDSTSDALAAYGIRPFEAYGASETTGIAAANRPGTAKAGTVGRAAPGVELSIGESSELLVSGRSVAIGYYDNPEATAKAFVNGKYRTGDIATLDDGFVALGGRLKDRFKLENGTWVRGGAIQQALACELIADSVIVGANRPFATALIALNPSVAKRIASGGDFTKDAAVVKAIEDQIAAVNASQSAPQDRIKGFHIIDRALTTGEDGEIGATGKIRPFKVLQNMASEIDAMYATKSSGQTATR